MRSTLHLLAGLGCFFTVCALPLRAAAEEGGVSTSGTAVSGEINPVLNAKYSLGAVLGAGILGSGSGAHVSFGLAAAGRFIPDVQSITFGAFFNHVSRGTVLASEAPNGVQVDSNLNFYGIEADYFPTTFLPGSHIGLKAALGDNSITTNGVNNSSTDVYLGPKVAYDAAIGSQVSAGLEASILLSPADSARTTTSILGTLKYWLG